jgi:hypothetical protein
MDELRAFRDPSISAKIESNPTRYTCQFFLVPLLRPDPQKGSKPRAYRSRPVLFSQISPE